MKKNRLSTFLLILVLVLGLSLLLYPSFSDYWNSLHQSRAIATYAEEVADLDTNRYRRIWDEALAFNRALLQRPNEFLMTEAEMEQYFTQLDPSDRGIMGYIEIPMIDVLLPIHHTVSESVLQTAIGHIEWSSLPTGGESTHCVLSGHRGLPSAKLFSDLDKVREGDLFSLRVLDELLTYEVDQILIVEPQETDALLVEEGKDLVTLVTCTPYGVNSHRLLIRGHRVANPEAAVELRVVSDAVQVEPLVVAPFVAVPLLIIMLIIMGAADTLRRKR